MGHVFFRPGRFKLVAVLPIAIFWFAHAGGAHAAFPSGNSIHGITQPSTTWQGQFYGSATSSVMLSEPRDCPPASGAGGDPGNLNCDHFQLLTQTTGQVRVVV